jgi:uncharacterized protein (DUF983 family)
MTCQESRDLEIQRKGWKLGVETAHCPDCGELNLVQGHGELVSVICACGAHWMGQQFPDCVQWQRGAAFAA